MLNSDRQSATIIDADGLEISSAGNASLTLPPMAGFFVKSKEAVSKLELAYTADMAVVGYQPEGENKPVNWLSAPKTASATRSDDDGTPGVMRITAVRDGLREGAALIRVDGAYSAEVNAAEDAETLVDPNISGFTTVYTVADGVALAINSTDNARGTEIGVMTDENKETTLLFEGDAANNGYRLYDAKTGKVMDVYDGMEYRMTGPAANRLYLSDAPGVGGDNGIKIAVENGEVVVTSMSGDELDVKVYDVPGRVLMTMDGYESPVRFTPDSGIIIVEATDGTSTAHKKLKIKN